MEFSKNLENHKDLHFVQELIDRLTLVIVAQPTHSKLRKVLTGHQSILEFAQSKEELFFALFKTWSYNPVSTLTLCFLTRNYELAHRLMPRFALIEMDISKLIALGSLVQLIESPVFANLRMELTRTDLKAQYLQKTMMQILMLLPLSKAFNQLRKRLQCLQLNNL